MTSITRYAPGDGAQELKPRIAIGLRSGLEAPELLVTIAAAAVPASISISTGRGARGFKLT